MQTIIYEKHPRMDPNFPIRFHPARNTQGLEGFYMHWHEHIEILYFIEGSTDMLIDNSQISVQKGNVAVVNSNCMHAMAKKPKDCKYHCLIIDKVFFNSFFEPLETANFKELIADERINSLFESIAFEMNLKQDYYKQTVMAYVSLLLSEMSRRYSVALSGLKEKIGGQKLAMVKNAIDYINIHYKESITIEDIVSSIGFSKYHFCHSFKEVTGHTAFDYINILRCNQARKLFASGNYNIGESALLSGFNNLSYFTKTYKKHMGILPSEDI